MSDQANRVNLLDLTPTQAAEVLGVFLGDRRPFVPRGAGGSPAVGEPGAIVCRHDRAAGGVARRARGSVRPAPPRAGRPPGLHGRDAQVSLPPARQRSHRDGRHPRRRPDDDLRFVAGRLRPSMRVLRDGRDGLQPQPRRPRDRRSGSRDAIARPADPRDEHRLHGHGRADDELEGGRSDADDPQRPERPRHRRAAHHRLHRRRAARHRRARGDGRSSSGWRSRSTRRRIRCGAS